MIGRLLILAFLAALAAAPALASDKPRKQKRTQGAERLTYSWIDENGNRQYGDRVPPEYAKKELRVLNSQGVELRRIEAQRTAAQQIEDRKREDSEARRAQHDRFLLATYTSTRDIEQVRDTRLAQIGQQRESTESYLATLQERLSSLQLQAQAYRPYNESPDARPLPDRLADSLVRTLNEVRTQRNLLDARRSEEAALRSQFQSDIDRYRQLRSGTATARN
ncbi:MAG: hypothetical protein R3E65_04535 [Steroidobacteraceae bacterium]